eukprot:gene167-165_t
MLERRSSGVIWVLGVGPKKQNRDFRRLAGWLLEGLQSVVRRDAVQAWRVMLECYARKRGLASGAIKGWDRRNGYYFAMLESLARHYTFDIEAPFESLPAPVQHAILHGSGDEEIAFSYIMDSGASKGKVHTKKHPFEGIIPNMARRYRETDSVVVREDLARFRSTQPCPECHGVRLRREARHVKVGEGTQARAIYEVSHATLSDAHAWFQSLQLTGAKAEIADKVPAPVVEAKPKSRFPQTEASKRRAERMAEHHARQAIRGGIWRLT